MNMKSLSILFACAYLSGCAFNFDVTSQRTALENQVMGSYKELEDELVMSKLYNLNGSLSFFFLSFCTVSGI